MIDDDSDEGGATKRGHARCALVAIGPEEIDVLRSLLEHKASRLKASEKADRAALASPAAGGQPKDGLADPRRRSVAAYRQGQRDILREALEDLAAMSGGARADADSDASDSE